MKPGMPLCLIMLLSLASLAQTSGPRSHSDDDAAIKQLVAQCAEYWNRHEFARTAELRTADSENVNVVGQRSTRADIAKGGPAARVVRCGSAGSTSKLSQSRTGFITRLCRSLARPAPPGARAKST
jgi:hypothetical protein